MTRIKNKVVLILFFYVANFCFALTGAKYLIITPDNFVSAVQPLADWKTKKGMKAKIVPMSVTGNSASQIKSYITNAYNNWDIRPQYILLAGHGTVVPYSGNSDDFYADMTGDYKIELSVSRFPATTVDQIANIVNKTLNYERFPYIEDTSWFRKGMTIIDEDYSGYPPTQYPDTEYWENARFCYTRWLSNGFIHVDSFSRNRGNNATNVINGINNGRSYIVYRGQTVSNWGNPFSVDPQSTTNGYKLPIIISATCATSSLYYNDYQGNRFINAGSATNPKGAVGFFATTVTAVGSGLARQRGTVAKGFHQALFDEGCYAMGDAAKRAKFLLDSIRPSGFSQTRYQEWQLFGDPELQMWTGAPSPINVSHDTIIVTQSQRFNVTVRANTVPLSSALVCIMMDTLIYQTNLTNASGVASFIISPSTTGIMSVTVTAHKFVPYERNVIVREGNLAHDVGVVSIIEPLGAINSGITIIPKVRVKNFGTNTDSFPVTFKIGAVYCETVQSVTLTPGESTVVLFPSWTSVGGNYVVRAYTALNSDQWPGNDTAIGNLNVIVLQNDVGIDAIISPDTSHLIHIAMRPRARVKNYGTVTQVNFTATCSIVNSSGVLKYFDTQTIASLTADDTITVSFNEWTSNVAEQCTVKIRTNLVGDENPANDRMIRGFRISMLFLAEGFNNSFPPTGWQNVIVQGNFSWQQTTSNINPNCSPYEGSSMVSYASYSAPLGSMARLISPPIALGTTPVPCSLKFFMYHDNGYPGGQGGPDSVKIEHSSNGITFNRVAAFRRYEPVNGWTEHAVYFDSLSGTVYFGILAFSQYGNNINIDYLRLLSPSSITEDEISTTSLPSKIILDVKPNPAINNSSQISFIISEPTVVALKIYNASGKLINTLVSRHLESGNYNYIWNGSDGQNKTVAKGIYFYTLETPYENLTKKMILLR